MISFAPIGSYAIGSDVTIVGSNSYDLTITVASPTLVATMNDWNLNVTVTQPTLVAELISGESFSLNKTILNPTLYASIISGQLFNFNQIVRGPSLTANITVEEFYSLNSIVRNATLIASLFESGGYTFARTIRIPSLVAIWNNDVINSTTTSTYVINTMNAAHSEYTNYGFNSYFKLANNYYGINSTGVWRLTGNLDNTTAIDSQVDLPLSSFDKQGLKACSDAIIFGRLQGDMEVIAVTDEQEEREGFVVPADDREGLHRIRVKIPKGLKGSTWQFKIKNIDGSQFAINNFEVFLRELQRIR